MTGGRASRGRSRRSPALVRQELRERGLAALHVVGEDHLADGADALLVEEHVLGAAEPDALGAEAARGAGVERRVGVGAHLHRADVVGPGHQLAELAGERRAHGGDGALEDVAGAAVDRDDVALLERDRLGRTSGVVVRVIVTVCSA